MKKFFVIVLMMILAGGAVFGQALPTLVGGGFTSPQAAATQGRLRSAADDFMRPDSYKNVSFEKWFAMTSFADGNNAALGYATKSGDMYLGMFYYGRFWTGIQTFGYTERRDDWHDSPKNDVRVYNTLPAFSGGNPLNQLAVLIGVGDMGFRLTLTSSYKHFEDSDFGVPDTRSVWDDDLQDFVDADVLTEYKSYQMGNGAISPQLAWSMTKNLTDKGIKPWATIDLVFNNTFTKGQEYDYSSNYAAGNESATSNKNTRLELNLGLGGYTIANKDGWRTSFDFEYRLRLDFYENEYTYTDIGSGYTRVKSISGRTTNNARPDEYKYNNHRLRPSFSTQWNGETLRLRAKLDLNIEITPSEVTPFQQTANGSLQKDGTATVTTVLGFNPDLRLAAQWQIHPKLFLNAGGQININALTITTTESETYSSGNKDANSSYKTTASAFGATSNALTLGVTFNPITNFSLEASCGVVSNSISVFSDTGLFSFGSILAKLTF